MYRRNVQTAFFSFFVLFIINIGNLQAQILFQENFNGANGVPISWPFDCGGSNINITAPGLAYTGYAGVGQGTAATITAASGSHSINFGGSGFPTYVGFLVSVQSANFISPSGCASGTDVILAFDPNSGGSSNDNGLVLQFVSGSQFMFGLSTDQGAQFGPVGNYNVTYLVVMRRDNSLLSLYVNPILGGAEPAAILTKAFTNGSGNPAIGLSISGRSGSDLMLDGIRVSSSWSDIVATSPSTQASNILFTTPPAPNFTTLDWTDGNGNGRIVLANQGGPIVDFPVDGTSYTGNSIFGSGSSLGSSFVVFNSCCGAKPAPVTNLLPETTYYFEVFEYNTVSGGAILYNTGITSGNPANTKTLAVDPAVQSSNIIFPSTTTNSITLSWANGSGTERLVVASNTGSIINFPADGTSYVGNSNYPAATDLGAEQRVVYRGVLNTVTVTNLTPNVQYAFRVFELNGTGSSTNYNTNVAFNNPNTRYTLANEPITQSSGINFSSVLNNSMQVNFTGGNGSQRIVIASAGVAVSQTPADGTTYSANGSFSLGTNLGSGNFAVYQGSGNSFVMSNLAPALTYHLQIFELNGISGEAYNYLTTTAANNPLSRITLSNEPVAHAASFTAVQSGSSQINLTFSAASTISGAAGYLILRRQDGANPTASGINDGAVTPPTPVAGTTLVTTITNTAATSYNDAGLSVATLYNYAIIPYGYNGVDPLTYNYRTLATIPIANATTLSLEPIGVPASFTATSSGTSQINLSFSAASTITNASGYIILRRQDGANPTATGVNDETATSSTPTLGTTLITTITNTATILFSDAVSPGTQYNYAIIPYGWNGSNTLTYNYYTSTSKVSNATTLSLEPLTHPAAFSAVTGGSNQIDLAFSAASTITNAAGYIILRRQNLDPTNAGIADATATPATPVAGTTLVTTISNTATTTFSDLSVSPGIQYNYAIFPFGYNGSNPLTFNYLLTAGNKTANAFTLSTEPAAHAASFNATQAGTNQINLAFSAASTITSAAGYIILRRSDGNNPTTAGIADGFVATGTPVPGTTLLTTITSNATISYNDTGVSPGLQYNYAIIPYGYNSANAQTYNYRTAATVPTANAFTLSLEPAGHAATFTATQSGTSQINLTFSAASSIVNAAGYIILRRQDGSNPNGANVNDGAATGTTPITGTTLVTTITNSSTTGFNDTGLSSGTQYNYAIIPFGYNGINAQTFNYRVAVTIPTNNATTLVPEPSAQPTALNFTTVVSTGFNVNFTGPLGGAAGYIAFRKIGSSPTTAIPADGTAYSVGNTLGDGYITFIGSATSFLESGLSISTVYFYDIFAFNGSGVTINYATVSQLEGSQITLATPVTTQATNILFPNGSITNNQALLNWTNGNGAKRIVLAHAGNTVDANPANGLSYTANTAFGTGTQVGTGNFVVYDGTGNTVTVSGLSPSSTYYFEVFDYNGTGTDNNFNITSAVGNPDQVLTRTDAPLANSAATVTSTSFTASWSAVTGSTGYFIDVSSDNFSTYVAGYNNQSVAGTSLNVIGLTGGITYQYQVRAANTTGPSVSSNVISKLMKPAAPVAINATGPTQVSFTANWNASTSATDYFVDVASDATFSTTVTGFDNKQVTGATSVPVTGLIAGTTYYYQVRALNGTGTSPNSNPVSQITVPPKPLNFKTTGSTSSTFVVQWDVATGASAYELDVQDENLNFVTGYNAKSVAANFHQVTGLLPAKPYLAIVRAVNAGGVSPNSDQLLVLTADATGGGGGQLVPPVINLTTTSTANAVKAAITASTGFNNTIMYYHRKITEAGFSSTGPVPGPSSEVTYDPAKDLDAIGMEYYFEAKDQFNQLSVTDRAFIYTAVSSQAIPELKVGGTLQSYQIFSIPVKLESNSISSVFQDVEAQYAGYDKTKWRLVHYQNGRNVDYKEGLNDIQQGKGYWFNAKDAVTVKVSGTAVPSNQSSDFILSLDAGWNQIGNPFPFEISWLDVLSKNVAAVSAGGVGKLLTYDAANVSFKESGGLKAWEGGFVKATQAATIKIPVTVKQSASGRLGLNEIENTDIGKPEWFVALSLRQGNSYNEMGGIGMHPLANNENDKFDEQSLPRFIKYLELNSYHEDCFLPRFTRDVVPPAESHNWNFVVESNFDDQSASLTWNNKSLGDNDALLMLYDADANILVDMKRNSEYRFELASKRSLKFFFSVDEKSLVPDITGLGRPYPNPSPSMVTIPFVAGIGRGDIQIAVYDLMGKLVRYVTRDHFEPGFHEVTWDGNDEQGGRVAAGMYIYRLESTGTASQQGRIVMR